MDVAVDAEVLSGASQQVAQVAVVSVADQAAALADSVVDPAAAVVLVEDSNLE